MSAIALAVAGIAMSAAQMANSFMSGQASAASQKKMLKLQKKQWELDVSKAYQDSLSTLNQLKTTYRQSGLEVAQTQANIESLDYWLQNYQGYYDFEMGQQQLAVDQQRNNVAGMFYSNIGNLRQMQEGLAQQQVLSAARGQTGSTARLLSAMARQEIINFAGEDMTLDAEGGEYGRQYTAQQGALDLAIMAQSQRQKDLEVEKMNKESDLEMQQLALQDYQVAQQEYLTSIGETLGSAIELGWTAGMEYDDLSKLVDEYRGYMNVSDAEYTTLKNKLLKNYAPVEFRLTSYSYGKEYGGDENGGTDFYNGYVTWVKDADTGLWNKATSEQLEGIRRNYGDDYIKKYIKDYGTSSIYDIGYIGSSRSNSGAGILFRGEGMSPSQNKIDQLRTQDAFQKYLDETPKKKR